MGKRNYFMGYGILLHKLPVVAVLFTESNNNKILYKQAKVALDSLDVVKYGINLVK